MTTTQQPDPCHHDRHLNQRVTARHRQTCTDRTCTGCAPCTAPHCPHCNRGHLDNNHPHTCPHCVANIRNTLSTIITTTRALTTQAYAGTNRKGRPLAAAPIPGGDAQVLLGPTVPFNQELALGRGYTDKMLTEDHNDRDPIPPLAVLANWEDQWRRALNLAPAGRATVVSACHFLRDTVVTVAAQRDPKTGGPDFAQMAWEVRWIRDQLERTLHDEREPDRGVQCFECDATLVRRYHRPKPCACPPRPMLEHAPHGRCYCIAGARIERDEHGDQAVIVTRTRDPEDGHIHQHPDLSCLACHQAAAWESLHAGHHQGGLTDPTVGMSWECGNCRKIYSPGEYQNAVRVELARTNGGWITIPIAAQAAEAVAGRPVTDKTVRGWVNREWVKSRMDLSPLGIPGPRLVQWTDVRREAERLGAGRNQCTHATPAREWVKVLTTYPELEISEDEWDGLRESCERCLLAVDATLRASRRSGSTGGRMGA